MNNHNFNFDWWAVSKTEYQLITSRFRRVRRYLPYLMAILGALWIYQIAPSMVEMAYDRVEPELLAIIALSMTQSFLFSSFILFITIPVISSLQEIEKEQLEIVLSSPIEPSHLLLGEFLGRVPLYAIPAIIIGGLFSACMAPLGLSWLQILLVNLIFVLTFITAFWIGQVIAVQIRHKLAKSPKSRDLARGFSILLIIPFVFLAYAIIGGYLNAMLDPGNMAQLNQVLEFVPSSWGSHVIIDFASNPGGIIPSGEALSWLAALLGFLVALFWFGVRLSKHAYQMEPSSFTISTITPGRSQPLLIKNKGSMSIHLITVMKIFFRKPKNLTQIAYALSLILAMNIFLGRDFSDEWPLIMSCNLNMLLTLFVVSELSLDGKEVQQLYKKSPAGMETLVKVKLQQYLLIIVPLSLLGIVMTILIIPGTNLAPAMLLGYSLVTSIPSVLFGMGVFMSNPVYDRKADSAKYSLNMQILVFGLALTYVFLMIFGNEVLSGVNRADMIIYAVYLWLAGPILFLRAYSGFKKTE